MKYKCHNFRGNQNKLRDLKGSPFIVSGIYNIRENKPLTSLEGSPESVGGFYSCGNCSNLESLKGMSPIIMSEALVYRCNLTSLEGIPDMVTYIDCEKQMNHKFTEDDIIAIKGEYRRDIDTI